MIQPQKAKDADNNGEKGSSCAVAGKRRAKTNNVQY